MTRFLLPALLATAAFAGGTQYELSGRIAPAGSASVSLFRVASPFTVSTLAGEDGRFTFKKLEPGAYTISVFDPARGEARRTIEIGPAGADEHGRVTLDLNLRDSDFVLGDTLRRRNSVSTRQLAIPDKAIREYEDAQKDLAKHEVAAAIQRLEHAVELAPQFSVAWNNLGTIAYQTQKYERAEECFRRALEADPRSYEPLVNLGGVLLNLNKIEEAWDYNVHAVLMRPADALANSQLGMTYFGMGRLDLAEKHFEIARKSDPAHFSHPQLFLAEIHLRRGDKHAAAADLEEFLKYHPDWPQAARMRAAIEEWKSSGRTDPQ
jgi:tetratricopeptide (TPR) repeat protein